MICISISTSKGSISSGLNIEMTITNLCFVVNRTLTAARVASR